MRKTFGISLLLLFVVATPCLAQRVVTFPQIASGGGWSSDFYFTNQDLFPITGITVGFVDDTGAPLMVSSNIGVSTSFTFTLNAGSTQLLRISPSTDLVVGYVVVSYPTNAPVRATEVFRCTQGGVVVAEVGVPQQEEGDNYSFLVESNYPKVRTAVALANPVDFNSGIPVAETVVLNLINLDGTIQRTTTVPLNPGAHLARYIDELFPNLGAFTGSISISSPFSVGILALREEDGSFGGVATDGGPILGPFVLSTAPVSEAEPNDAASTAQNISGSTVIAGTIQPAGDQDVYTFSGKAGSTISVICTTQGLGSDLDSIIEIYDRNLKLLALNDQNGLAPGLYPQNDSFVQMVLPADGTYYIVVVDYFNQGGSTYTYRLHLKLS